MTATIAQPTTTADAFSERIFESVLGVMDAWSVYVGDKLGLYEFFSDRGPSRSTDLVAGTGMHSRYAQEWLEQQVTTGILTVDDPAAPPEHRVYDLPAGHAEVLTDRDSLAYLAPFIRLVTAAGVQLPSIVEAYRSGGGVSWERFGEDMRTGQAEMNRPWFLQPLGQEWLPSIPDIHERLSNGARLADVGCGEGWSSIGIATAYPHALVDAFDVDAPSIEAARRHAVAAGVDDRVTFHLADVATLADSGGYDVVTAFECIHDMPHPVEILSAMNRLAGPDGAVVVMDEAVGDAFGERFDEVERLMYGFSLFVCLPDGMAHDRSAGTGTVMRPSTLAGYAESAGFASVNVLPIENDLWRFYRLER